MKLRRNLKRLVLLFMLPMMIGISSRNVLAESPTVSDCIRVCDLALEARDAHIEQLEVTLEETEVLALEEAKEVDRLSSPIRRPVVWSLGGGLAALTGGPVAALAVVALALLF